LEIGIGDLTQTLRMVGLAARWTPGEAVRYAAIDLFEARSGGEKLTLKDAHRQFKAAGAVAQLIPGEPARALAAAANSLGKVDVVIIGAEQSEAALEGAWFYLPRILQAGSVVLRETRNEAGATVFQPLDAGEIQAKASTGRRRAA
jgi:hypothetical protein